MLKNKLAFPLTATALAVLLAACGGSGSDTPDSSGAAPKDAPAPLAEKAPDGPPIDATGVRGDLLLSMMDHRACHHAYPKAAASHDGPRIEADRLDVVTLEVKAGLSPTNYRLNPDAKWPAGPTPGFDPTCSQYYYAYAPFTGGSAELVQRTGAYTFRGNPDLRALRPFLWAETRTPITLTGNTVTLGTNQSVIRQNETTPMTLISANAYTFHTDERIPYGQLLQWGQGERFTELMLLSADNAKQAKLCWNVHVGATRRLHCTVWEVPEGWQRGNGTLNLQDQYVVDDRSVHAGESGHRFWRGNF